MVVLHEAAHIRRGHSRDLRLMQVAETLYWFNPLLRRCTAELKRLHDLEADRDTLADVGREAEQEACEHESVQATAPPTSEPTADDAHKAEPKPASAAGHHAEQAETTVVVKHPTTPSEVTIDGSTQELHHKDISFQFTVTHSETGRPATEEEKSSISPHLTKLLSSLVGSSADTTQP